MILIGLLIVVLLGAGWIAFCGYRWSWGPFAGLHQLVTARYPGNGAEYAVSTVEKADDSPLENKRIAFLGSSVTYGSAAMGVSFADYICAHTGAMMAKEAVSGTTLVDNGPASYVARIKKLDQNAPTDLFVCQLSTNDAWTPSAVGDFRGPAASGYDTGTVAGAIETILAYVRDTWGCPVVFYTSPRFISDKYDQMVAKLNAAASMWGYTVIDMWNDEAFCNLTEAQSSLWKADDIHPTQAGYRDWWMPYMEPVLCEAIDQ